MKEDELLAALQTRIGLKITTLRKEKGYTSHEDFAHEHDIPRMQYWRIEKGKTNLTLRTLTKILLIHGLTIEQFFASLPKESRKTARSTKECP
ncbi:helix-turn-helix domain-containing protein [Parachryseolinea silvisoli]|uniref:helix-turn-helix domain-containing protein n=1 Tax=Parachryseolinea silvisoli TaxID=2873601 RepID=UPI002265E04E|nr:helix-turn-helix transcriptional regulator [Parachryseolinea silvisoli]MCD9014456.1 helix-turn-helix domain-containing protein [Parachryseolinea silvisoli]